MKKLKITIACLVSALLAGTARFLRSFQSPEPTRSPLPDLEPGYRRLEIGEVIKSSDEVFEPEHDSWTPASLWVGTDIAEEDIKWFRRPTNLSPHYRYLKEGEMIRVGDEVAMSPSSLDAESRWCPTCRTGGQVRPVVDSGLVYRRRLAAPASIGQPPKADTVLASASPYRSSTVSDDTTSQMAHLTMVNALSTPSEPSAPLSQDGKLVWGSKTEPEVTTPAAGTCASGRGCSGSWGDVSHAPSESYSGGSYSSSSSDSSDSGSSSSGSDSGGGGSSD